MKEGYRVWSDIRRRRSMTMGQAARLFLLTAALGELFALAFGPRPMAFVVGALVGAALALVVEVALLAWRDHRD